jgi:hypothetical protein
MMTSPSPVALLLLAIAGCTAVPSNRIEANFKAGTLAIHSPKNADVQNLVIDYQTNGVVRVSVARWCSTNDAQVIDRASAGRAAEFQAMGNLVKEVTAAAVDTAAQSASPW